MKKIISLLMTLCVVFSMSITAVNAETVQVVTTETAYGLTIIDNTVTPAKNYELTGLQLDQLATTKNHSYSGINNQGTVKIEKDLYGVSLKTLLKQAGFKNDKQLKKIKSIVFDAAGDTKTINTSDLFATRYYYSKLDKFNAVKGKVLTDKAQKNRKVVEPIIALGDEEAQNAKLYFGQAYASERNWPAFWGGITTITLNKTAAKTEKCEAPFAWLNKVVPVGTPIAFKPLKGFIYYTINGKNPTQKNAIIYNFAPKLNEQGVNAKVFNKVGTYTIKAVTKDFGKTSSKVSKKTIKVVSVKEYEKKYADKQPELLTPNPDNK